MRTRARTLILGTAATLVFLGACGGDDDATATPSTASSATSVTSAGAAASPDKVPVVLDTDLATDDIVALTYLTSDPRVDLRAVTVSGTGEIRCPRGADVARGLLARMGRAEVPVACGRSTPLAGTREFPEAWRDGADNAYGLLLEVVSAPAEQPTAAELLADAIAAAPQPVVLLTLGPLTNVADAIAAEPDFASNIARIVTMGGAVDVPGNVIPDGASEPNAVEWNLYVDPTAADVVLRSGIPITLVSLDATNQVPLDDDVMKRIEANDTTEATHRVLHVFDVFPPPYLWDTLAAIAVTDAALVPTHPAALTVVTEGDEAGRTVASADGAPVDVAEVPDAGAVIDRLLRTLAGVGSGEELATPTTLPLLGEVMIDFDGTTCSYGGPATLPEGAYAVSTGAGTSQYVAAVAHLTEGATADDVVAWVAEHPNEEPPMVDEITVVGGWGEPSPATVAFHSGTVAIACGTEDGAVHIAATIDVTE